MPETLSDFMHPVFAALLGFALLWLGFRVSGGRPLSRENSLLRLLIVALLTVLGFGLLWLTEQYWDIGPDYEVLAALVIVLLALVELLAVGASRLADTGLGPWPLVLLSLAVFLPLPLKWLAGIQAALFILVLVLPKNLWPRVPEQKEPPSGK